MDRCPKCKRHTVTYDGYRGVRRCMVDGCTCVVIDHKSYSYLKRDSKQKEIHRVRVVDGVEKGTLKKYQLL